MENMMRSENEPLEPKITSIGKGKSSSKPSFFGFHVNFAGCRTKIIFEHVPQQVGKSDFKVEPRIWHGRVDCQ